VCCSELEQQLLPQLYVHARTRYDVFCCNVLQCIPVCCSVLQCVAVCCSAFQCVAVCCNIAIASTVDIRMNAV